MRALSLCNSTEWNEMPRVSQPGQCQVKLKPHSPGSRFSTLPSTSFCAFLSPPNPEMFSSWNKVCLLNYMTPGTFEKLCTLSTWRTGTPSINAFILLGFSATSRQLGQQHIWCWCQSSFSYLPLSSWRTPFLKLKPYHQLTENFKITMTKSQSWAAGLGSKEMFEEWLLKDKGKSVTEAMH